MRMSYKKGKDVKKKSKLGMVSVNLGLDKNKNVTQADIKGKFIARKKAMGGGMMRKQFGKGGGADTHVTKDGRTVKKGLYYYMNRAKKKGTSKSGKGSVTDKALKASAKTAKKPTKKA
jgi:protein-disulfide isomerase-like protein with CxxC motif